MVRVLFTGSSCITNDGDESDDKFILSGTRGPDDRVLFGLFGPHLMDCQPDPEREGN
jgi:hypothetical protein